MYLVQNLLIIFYICYEIECQFECADELQRCAMNVASMERQMNEIRSQIFRQCNQQAACHSERLAFDQCFGISLQSVNSNFAPGEFAETSAHLRQSLRRCFRSVNDFQTNPANSFTGDGGNLVDIESAYKSAIFNSDYEETLWGLQPLEQLKQPRVCFASAADLGIRLFGNGISRIVNSADPRINNLNTSCFLMDSDIGCYHIRLSAHSTFQRLKLSRDQTLHSCIQSLRQLAACRVASMAESSIRSCFCNAKEEFELRLQTDLLRCVRRSAVGRLHTANIVTISAQPHQQPITPFTQQQLTPGLLLNGQCMCSCNSFNFASINDNERAIVRNFENFYWNNPMRRPTKK